VLPPDIAKLLPKNRLLSEVRRRARRALRRRRSSAAARRSRRCGWARARRVPLQRNARRCTLC
jgi:hypothetical protein